jgi:hypothetical protein
MEAVALRSDCTRRGAMGKIESNTWNDALCGMRTKKSLSFVKVSEGASTARTYVVPTTHVMHSR